jgi:signal transduction histidine kinase
MLHDYQDDINDVAAIPGIDTLLKMVCRTTGMGFSAVARVTETRWITCQANDIIGFGLKPGDELSLETTICNEIRHSGKGVVIDSVLDDITFKDHHTPAMYGFQSYISVPILRRDGSFFGTLCAIDPLPRNVSDPEVTDLFKLFTNLISLHLYTAEALRQNEKKITEEAEIKAALEAMVTRRTAELEQKNQLLIKANKELEAFAYISSHDLQEPLRKIQTIASAILAKDADNLSATGRDYFNRMQNAAQRMQKLINDLLLYSRTSIPEAPNGDADINAILTEVITDLEEEILNSKAVITIKSSCNARVVPFQIQQVFMNLINNAIKFSSKERTPKIVIDCEIIENANPLWDTDKVFHLSISDNGIGFEQKFTDRIFEVFQRLHEKSEYSGTGIGLAIVKKIVENHNGTISVKSVKNEGTTFSILLPQ